MRSTSADDRGQSLVEFALVTPVMLAILLGVAGIFYLDLSVRRMQNGIDVLAEQAAQGPQWPASVQSENQRVACHADPLMPTVVWPDGQKGQKPGQRVLLTWHCHLLTNWIFDHWPITVESEAVTR